ncbi:MAG: choloylglycine hydrolase family protein [bacterium]
MKKTILTCTILCLIFSNKLLTCTNFQVKAKDGSVVIGRTMEFPVDIKSNIWLVPRGEQYTSISDKKVKGLSWKTKHAFLALDGFDLSSNYIDGMNEKGLSVGGLMFVGAKYQEAIPGNFVNNTDFASWILGNFATVDEVKKELEKINVVDMPLKKLHGSMGLHFDITDTSGNSIVVEFIAGEKKIYENKVGVLTNRPDFNWQTTNLSNYINLQHEDKEPRTINAHKIIPTGVGSGMLGLPGDWTPPSRFVKVAYALDASTPAKNSIEAVNLAEHIMNMVDIPKGVIKEKVNPVIHVYGYAQWSIIKDLKNKIMYFRTYDNVGLKKIEMSKLNMAEGAKKKSFAIEKQFANAIDVTEQVQ